MEANYVGDNGSEQPLTELYNSSKPNIKAPGQASEQIQILVGKSGDTPVVILQFGEERQIVFTINEAVNLGSTILISCGIALERAKG